MGKSSRRLRSIGMNLVFFDTDAAHPFADSVFLDNTDAVETLLQAGDAFEEFMYVGWDNLYVSNIRKREEAYRKIHPDGKVENVPWKRDRRIERESLERIKELTEKMGKRSYPVRGRRDWNASVRISDRAKRI